MKKPSIAVIGAGIVGNNLLKQFDWAEAHDPFKGMHAGHSHYDFAFVCVQTPSMPDGACDTQYVERAFDEINADMYILKSTVPPGTTDELIKRTGKSIVFSPEYQGETLHANNVDYDFVILGGNKDDTRYAAQLFQYAFTAELRVTHTSAIAAELTKYMENTFLATKVIFCNEFYRLAKHLNIEYSELRELFLHDPRVGRSHTFVYERTPFYDSKCLNKDVPAIVRFAESKGVDLSLIRAVIDRNEQFKQQHGG